MTPTRLPVSSSSLNRSEDSAANVEFRSKAVSSRATADQVGAIWIDNLT
jgi:hypothetical protein